VLAFIPPFGDIRFTFERNIEVGVIDMYIFSHHYIYLFRFTAQNNMTGEAIRGWDL
tara:strand:+ start:10180 stop:10347 length:168 start_codon:yes stop_codon:yes gene_type:complete